MLLTAALSELPTTVATLDAWTREDPPALSWYRQNGFEQRCQYLHVYKNDDTSTAGFGAPSPLTAVVRAFCHAELEHEGILRSRFDRVYLCIQYVRKVSR